MEKGSSNAGGLGFIDWEICLKMQRLQERRIRMMN